MNYLLVVDFEVRYMTGKLLVAALLELREEETKSPRNDSSVDVPEAGGVRDSSSANVGSVVWVKSCAYPARIV